MEAEKHFKGGGAPLRTETEKRPQSALYKAWVGVAIMAALIILAAILCGCSTARRSTHDVRDSVVIKYKDSLVLWVKESLAIRIKDSTAVHVKDSTVIVLDEAGNIKSKESWHSTDTLKDRETAASEHKAAESVLIAEVDNRTAHTEKEATIKEYKPNLMDRIKLATWPFLIAVIVSIIIVWLARTKFKI